MLYYLQFILNGVAVSTHTEAGNTLLNCLREQFHLTSLKRGCQTGDCGTCTVLINELPIRACTTLALSVNNANVKTVEGLQDNLSSRLQESFLEHGAIQCGFCTPGMLIAAYALLKSNPDPTGEQIREAMAGQLCRCTGYVQIIEAINACASQGI